MKTKRVMIQGTASSVGKSIITTALLNILAKQGHSCAPFKSQNVTSYTYVTRDGLEIARSQAVQAFAAGTEPEASMNPILLKPVSGKGCEVVFMGRPYGDLTAEEYASLKPKLYEVIRCCFNDLAERYEIVLIEGAGSPVEINLLKNDIVNMGVAELLDSPVILVTDIERGGMFASVVGTLALMTEAQRQRVKGIIINKFIGDTALFAEGARMLEDIIKIPVLGIIPYGDFDIEEEDVLTGIKGFPGHLTNKAGTGSRPTPADLGIDEAGCRQMEYDRLGEHVKKHLDMDKIYEILDGSVQNEM